MDKTKKVRYVFSVFMVMLMVGIAEWTGEKEIIFPEMAALAVGLWVIDKRVWKVGRWQLIGLMTADWADDSRGCCRSLYRALLYAAVALQFMPGICLCRLLPAVQPGYSDSTDFGLYAAGAAAH